MSPTRLALVVQVVFWCCVNCNVPWRLPVQNLASESTPLVKPTFQFVKNRITVSSRNYSSSIWPTPSPSQTAGVDTETSKTYKSFYKLFYGHSDVPVKKPSTTSPPRGRIILDNRRSTNDMQDITKASTHLLQILENARCSSPKPRVVRVRDLYPDPSKSYQPSCTILHRCTDDTGCCTDGYTCMPRLIQEVSLYFYNVGAIRARAGLSNDMEDAIQALLFENHTACECVPLNDTPRSLRSVLLSGHNPSWSSKNPNSSPWSVESSRYQASESAPTPATIFATTTTTTTESPQAEAVVLAPRYYCPNATKCPPCPLPFTMRFFEDGRCSCDCFDKDKPCLKIKRGNKPLENRERRCVEQSYCHVPDCDFGSYMYDTGTCPRKPEKFRKEGCDHHHHKIDKLRDYKERD